MITDEQYRELGLEWCAIVRETMDLTDRMLEVLETEGKDAPVLFEMDAQYERLRQRSNGIRPLLDEWLADAVSRSGSADQGCEQQPGV